MISIFGLWRSSRVRGLSGLFFVCLSLELFEAWNTHYDAYQLTMLTTQLQGFLTNELLFLQLYNLLVASA